MFYSYNNTRIVLIPCKQKDQKCYESQSQSPSEHICSICMISYNREYTSFTRTRHCLNIKRTNKQYLSKRRWSIPPHSRAIVSMKQTIYRSAISLLINRGTYSSSIVKKQNIQIQPRKLLILLELQAYRTSRTYRKDLSTISSYLILKFVASSRHFYKENSKYSFKTEH